MSFPKQVAIFNAEFVDVGTPDEALRITWNYPTGNPGNHLFMVGTDIFLESPINMSQVEDEQLIASLSMAAILSGSLPGTLEFIDSVTNQGQKYFQTIIGNATLKTVTPVIDSNVGPLGTVFDITFNKVGNANNTKTIRADAWNIAQYSNRVDSPAHSVYCVPGAVHKQFGLKKSELGADQSATRQSIIDFIVAQKFWI